MVPQDVGTYLSIRNCMRNSSWSKTIAQNGSAHFINCHVLGGATTADQRRTINVKSRQVGRFWSDDHSNQCMASIKTPSPILVLHQCPQVHQSLPLAWSTTHSTCVVCCSSGFGSIHLIFTLPSIAKLDSSSCRGIIRMHQDTINNSVSISIAFTMCVSSFWLSVTFVALQVSSQWIRHRFDQPLCVHI